MFGKQKSYNNVTFPADKIESAIAEFDGLLAAKGEKIRKIRLSYTNNNEEITINDAQEPHKTIAFSAEEFRFTAESDKTRKELSIIKSRYRLYIDISNLDDIHQADNIIKIFDDNYKLYKAPPEEKISKKKEYEHVKFPPKLFENTIAEFKKLLSSNGEDLAEAYLCYEIGNEEVTISSAEAHHRLKGFESRNFYLYIDSESSAKRLTIREHYNNTSIELSNIDNVSDADKILYILDNNYQNYKNKPEENLKNIKIFIGHGRSYLWRDLKDHLTDLHGLKVSAYETGIRAGYTIQEVLQEMSEESAIAFLVHTGEDLDKEDHAHARENVIHETGLFQGKLGFKRAIVLLEEGCNEFSNLYGNQQLRFSKGNIKETFGHVIATIHREFLK